MRQQSTAQEFWLSGPLPGIPPLLQPAAHALVQAQREVNEMMADFPEDLLWETPAGMASPCFHLKHLAGVLDRLFTYANGHSLNDEQLNFLAAESTNDGTVMSLLAQFNHQIGQSISRLSQTSETVLTEAGFVGRKQIQSTVIGLLMHAAEHTMRHTGQLLVTVNVLKERFANGKISSR